MVKNLRFPVLGRSSTPTLPSPTTISVGDISSARIPVSDGGVDVVTMVTYRDRFRTDFRIDDSPMVSTCEPSEPASTLTGWLPPDSVATCCIRSGACALVEPKDAISLMQGLEVRPSSWRVLWKSKQTRFFSECDSSFSLRCLSHKFGSDAVAFMHILCGTALGKKQSWVASGGLVVYRQFVCSMFSLLQNFVRELL